MITPNGGSFNGSQSVSITTATAGAEIYYTLDGTPPSDASTGYTGAFTLTTGATVKAIAVKSGYESSQVITAVFTKQANNNDGGNGGSGGDDYTGAFLSQTSADYDLNNGGGLTITVSRGSYSLRNIKNGDYVLKEGTDYTVSGNRYTLTESYLMSLDAGIHSIVFDMSGGIDPKFTLTVRDTRPSATEPPADPVTEPTEPFANPFTDLNVNDWYYDAVAYVYQNGLMSGTGTEPMMFSPNMPLSRGMIVTILYRVADEPDVSGLSNPFSDVDGEAWYNDAAVWAASNGIVSGIGGGLYAPDNAISRQDLALILSRYADFAGITLPEAREYSGFIDDADIADYAKEAIERFFKAMIINGKGGNAFDPKGEATRAEVAAMLMKFLEAADDEQ